jgi:hypothetical protein
VVGRSDDRRLVALMLSSHDHDGDRGWLAIGSGPWDGQGRPSWVRSDRILAVPAGAVRREGAILPRATYDGIVRDLRMPGPAAPGAPASAQAAGPGGLRGTLRRLLGRDR